MKKSEIIAMARQYLFDVQQKIWTEKELEDMVEVAAEEYSSDTAEFRGFAEFTPVWDARFKYPDDFIRYEVGWNTEDSNVEISCMHDLERLIPGYNSVYGVPEYICEDLESRGYYNLYPVPVKADDLEISEFVRTDVPEIILNPDLYERLDYSEYAVQVNVDNTGKYYNEYGVEQNDEFGTSRPGEDYGFIDKVKEYVYEVNYGFIQNDEYGIEGYSGDYGCAIYIINFDRIGSYMYVRCGSPEEIKDYMALVYHVCYQAYRTDSDFADADAAALYLSKYNNRVAMFNHVRHKLTGRQRSCGFY